MNFQDYVAAVVSVLVLSTAPSFAAPAQGTADAVPSISGGIGQDEARAIRQVADDYSLGLNFASRSGQLLADVDVEVKDASGKVFYSGTAKGPIVLVDLPEGRYTVEATFRGSTLRQSVTLDDKRSRSITLNWPLDDRL